VCERLGIRSPSIFAHIKGRQEIAEAVAREVLGQLAAIPA
jgi:AcrR family transcriptional regulator